MYSLVHFYHASRLELREIYSLPKMTCAGNKMLARCRSVRRRWRGQATRTEILCHNGFTVNHSPVLLLSLGSEAPGSCSPRRPAARTRSATTSIDSHVPMGFALPIDHLQSRFQEAQCVGHPGMPRRAAGHLGRVVGDDHSIKIVLLQNAQNTDHIHVSVVDESFLVVWHLAAHVSQMDIGELVLAAVLLNGIVDISFGHLSDRADTELQRIASTGVKVDQL